MKTATLLIVGRHVQSDSKFWYLSNDSLRSSSFETVAALVFHSTKLTKNGSRLFFLVVVSKKSAGHEVSVAIKHESLTLFFEQKVGSMSRSSIWSAASKRLLYC